MKPLYSVPHCRELSLHRVSGVSSVVLPRGVLCIVQETFAKEGLNFSMEGKTGNTLNSHRLIALAGQQGLDKQDKLVELLFKAYFTEVQQQMLSSPGPHT